MAKFTVNTHHAYLNNDIIIKTDGQITIEDTVTGQKYDFQNMLKTHLSASHHILKSNKHEEEIFIEDAINLGGDQVKNAFVFDDNPWVFITTKDRIYIIHTETFNKKIEYNITPEEIKSLPSHSYEKADEYFLFKTHNNFAIYNVLTSKIIFQFTNYIFANNHLVIYKQEDGNIVIYDFRKHKTIVSFDGQYSMGKKFYFVKDKMLHGLNFTTSYINTIPYVGEVGNSDMLFYNYLLRLNYDYPHKKTYTYFDLGNGEDVKFMSKTNLISPYYIESWNSVVPYNIKEWNDGITPHFVLAKENLKKYNKEHILNIGAFNILGIRINHKNYRYEDCKRIIELHCELISHPTMNFTVHFLADGVEGETIDLTKYTIEIPQKVEEKKEQEVLYTLDNGENEIGKSKSNNLLVTRDEDCVYLRNLKKDEKRRILKNCNQKMQ